VTPRDAAVAALIAIHVSGDPSAPSNAAHWRTVDRYLRDGHAPSDVHQEILVAILLGIRTMRERKPKRVMSWLRAVGRSARVDRSRTFGRFDRRRVHIRSDEPTGVDLFPGEPPVDPRGVFERIELVVEARVAAHTVSIIEDDTRCRRRLQARLALHRLVFGASGEELRKLAPDLSDDLLYKSVERGRQVLADAFTGIATQTEADALVADGVLEAMQLRRVDAGRPRPERRKAA
jgi:DNA-directed RNA polymerase specialized sigma24 family protein